MKFLIHANIAREDDGNHVSRDVPTFIIDGDIQGIVSGGTDSPEEQAARIAKRIVDPWGDHAVFVAAYAIDDDIVIDLDAVHANLTR